MKEGTPGEPRNATEQEEGGEHLFKGLGSLRGILRRRVQAAYASCASVVRLGKELLSRDWLLPRVENSLALGDPQ